MGRVGQVAPRGTAASEVVGIVWPNPSLPQVMGWSLQSVRCRHMRKRRSDLRPRRGREVRAVRAWTCVARQGGAFLRQRPSGGMNDHTPATILVAADDTATRTFLADERTADRCELLAVDTASDALRLLETKFPDLAIIDVGLPDRSGLEVVRRVRGADGVVSRIDRELP